MNFSNKGEFIQKKKKKLEKISRKSFCKDSINRNGFVSNRIGNCHKGVKKTYFRNKYLDQE